jgi:pyridoxal phosphate enzyme (YggS family)
VEAALAAGQTVFGENRVQEAAAKFPPLRPSHPALELRIIGALQTNKARDAVRLADAIESLDRPRLAAALADAMRKEERRPEVLVQVNTAARRKGRRCRAPTRTPSSACAATGTAWRFSGLMCIPPFDEDPRPHFGFLAELAARHALPALSMGMSGDFEAAIACGATHVRLGTAIFGARSPLPAAPGPG